MHVLYIKTNRKNVVFQDMKFDAVYSDGSDSEAGLRACLCSLKRGDTLYIAAETDMGSSFIEVVGMFGDLARRGISIWVERQKRLFNCETSPFLSLGKDLAHDIVDFRDAFTRVRARRGIDRALDRRAGALPEIFEDLCMQWATKKISISRGAEQLGWKPATFYARARKFLADRFIAAVRREDDSLA